MKKMTAIAIALAAMFGLGYGSRARAQVVEVDTPVPWVSDIQGPDDGLMIKQADTDWFEATTNTPIGEGDMVWQDKGGRSEIYIDKSTYVRLDENSGVMFDKLGSKEVRVIVTNGSVEAANGMSSPLLVDVPGQTAVIGRGGVARIDVDEDGNTRVSSRKGDVSVEGPSGSMRVNAGQTLSADAEGGNVSLSRGGTNDGLSGYSDNRNNSFRAGGANPPTAALSHMPEPVAADMARNGNWINDAEYGWVWQPRNIKPEWAPYRVGRWVHRPSWGWTWVSYEPWGWYPHHHGRWVVSSRGWVWTPVRVRYWSPGIVFWVEGPDYIAWQPWPHNVSLHVSLGPHYIHHRYITTVSYVHFRDCNYYRYVRPWHGHCHNCRVYYSPDRFAHHNVRVHYNNHRTSRPNGYVHRGRSPRDRDVYAHYNRGRGGHRDGPTVHYGSANRPPNRHEASRTDRRPPSAAHARPGNDNRSRPPVTSNNGRPSAGNRNDIRNDRHDYGYVNRSRPSSGHDASRSGRDTKPPAATRSGNGGRPTAVTRPGNDSNRGRPSSTRDGSGYVNRSRPSTGTSNRGTVDRSNNHSRPPATINRGNNGGRSGTVTRPPASNRSNPGRTSPSYNRGSTRTESARPNTSVNRSSNRSSNTHVDRSSGSSNRSSSSSVNRSRGSSNRSSSSSVNRSRSSNRSSSGNRSRSSRSSSGSSSRGSSRSRPR